MRVLLTGASSFTGYWFARALVEQGHEVVAALRGRLSDYDRLRRLRTRSLGDCCSLVEDCAFGGPRFLGVLDDMDGPDLLCHHGARVGDHRSDAFDPLAALAGNTHNIERVVVRLAEAGCQGLVVTGSVFEADEGCGDAPLRAFNAYGLSKTLTWQTCLFHAARVGIPIGKFVIPNPFGPMEHGGFTSYMAHSWLKGEVPRAQTPDYVRDNIHVTLLARAYADFCKTQHAGSDNLRIGPSGYRGSQGDFSRRFAQAMAPRLGLACPVTLARQTDASEPVVRTNVDDLDHASLGWDEDAAWDELAAFYRDRFAGRQIDH